jgi:hypothetical protein
MAFVKQYEGEMPTVQLALVPRDTDESAGNIFFDGGDTVGKLQGYLNFQGGGFMGPCTSRCCATWLKACAPEMLQT